FTTNRGRLVVYDLLKNKKTEGKYESFSSKPIFFEKKILVGTMSGKILTINTSAKSEDVIVLPRDYGPASYICLTKNEFYIGTWKGSILIYTRKGKKPFILNELRGQVGPITGIILRNGNLYSSAQDGTVRVWKLDEKKTIHIFKHTRPLQAMEVSDDGTLVIAAPVSQDLILWNTKNSPLPVLLKGHEYLVYSTAWSPDMKLIASASGDCTAKIWDPFERKELKTLVGHSESVFAVCWNPQGNLVATGSPDKTLRIWDVASGNCINIMEHSDTVYTAAWSPNGKYIATGSPEGTLTVWDANIGTMQAQLNFNEWIDSLEWTPNNEYIIVNNKYLVYVIE
ncbi:MAG: hypothetical protein QXL15_00970, partial [Candidatus Korarchaeota archaeon]